MRFSALGRASLLVLFGVGGCTTASTPLPPAVCPSSTAPSVKSENTTANASAPKEKPALQFELAPNPSSATIAISLIVEPALAEKIPSFSIKVPDAAAASIQEATDAKGKLELREERGPEKTKWTPARPIAGKLALKYTVQTRIEEGKLPWVLVDPDRLEVMGEALLLPDVDENQKYSVAVKLDLAVYGTDGERGTFISGGASSYGIGSSREMTTSMRELRNAAFAAGRMGTAVFDALEGHDEAAWFGYTAFDPRPVSADTAAFRTAAAEFFGERATTPQTLLIMPVPGPAGAFVASRKTHSVLLHVAVADTWSAPLRIATAVETLHAWIGERLWIGPEEASRVYEGAWFADGFARYLARDLLFRFGLVTPLELAAEVNSLESSLAMSPFANEGNAALAARTKEAGVVQTLVARGALYATYVDAAIRQKSQNKRTLNDVIRALYKKAAEKRGPLNTTAWIETMQAELGANGPKDFAAIIEKGTTMDLPSNALGPCFRKEARTYAQYDLGFDDVASGQSKPPKAIGVRKDGPAYRAGLRDGMEIANLRRNAGRSDVEAVVSIVKGEKTESIQYLPAGVQVKSRGWIRVKDVPDEKCAK
jgi:predicted metalloprotease with PDZ domain